MFYLDLFRALEDRKVRYMLVGGLAMNLHGVPRMTMDVDLVLALDDANLVSFVAAARDLGLVPVAPVALEDLCIPAKRHAWSTERHMIAFALRPPNPDGPTVDVLINPPLDIEDALSRAERRDLAGAGVFVASVDDMIKLKEKSGRAQDRADIEHLRRVRGS